MDQLTSSRIVKATQAALVPLDQADLDLAARILVRALPSPETEVSDGGTAATAQAEKNLFRNRYGTNMRVVDVRFASSVGITADNTNYATITVSRRDAAGANAATVATGTTQVTGLGSLTAFAEVALPLTAANVIIPPGGSLTVAVAKPGNGVAIASATAPAIVTVELEPAD